MVGWDLVGICLGFVLLVMVSGYIDIDTHFACADMFLLYDLFIPEIKTCYLQEGRSNRGESVGEAIIEKEKEKKKKSISTLKSVSQVTKAWGNKLSPKLEKKKVKSKVALMKVRNMLKISCQ